jgi:hypothetical protein
MKKKPPPEAQPAKSPQPVTDDGITVAVVIIAPDWSASFVVVAPVLRDALIKISGPHRIADPRADQASKLRERAAAH